LAEQIQAAVESIGAFESKVLATRDDAQRRTDDSSAASRLVKLLADTDHQLSRAVDAATQWGAAQRKLDDAEDGGVQRHVAEMGRLARWLARHLLAYVAEQRAARAAVDMNPTLEGLNLIAARLRREMNEQGIQRIDTLGKPFDADTMCAIGV